MRGQAPDFGDLSPLLEAAARAVVFDKYTVKEAQTEFKVPVKDLVLMIEIQRSYLDPEHIEKREKLKEAWERKEIGKEQKRVLES